ncbi:MAG: phosphoglycerate mutase family protein [Candidatus Cloacimonas sp.]|nr:histidine phosphatase family protein [Candidatus Cloacimonadota bacterium]
MRIYIIRHGTASHLLEDLNQKVTRSEFLAILEEWEESKLTPLGEEEIEAKAKQLDNDFDYLYYSPLKRTEQTAKGFIKELKDPTHIEAIPGLVEIFIKPPSLPKKMKLKLKYWVALCVIRSLYTLRLTLYIKQARQILRYIKKAEGNALIVSHQARIITIIMYCKLSLKWRVVKTDFTPAGISIIESR